MNEEELTELIVDAHAEYLDCNPSHLYDPADLSYFIGYRLFKKLGLDLMDDKLYDKDHLVAKKIKITYDMDTFKIDLIMVDPAYKAVWDLSGHKGNGKKKGKI